MLLPPPDPKKGVFILFVMILVYLILLEVFYAILY